MIWVVKKVILSYLKLRAELEENEGLCRDNIDDIVYRYLSKEQKRMERQVLSHDNRRP